MDQREKPEQLSATIIRPQGNRSLDPFFSPRAVAVIGASESAESVGRAVLSNLLVHPFGGMVFPVNPKRRSVLGVQAYPSVKAIPAAVDLAIIATPAETVPGVIRECVECGVAAAIILSAGFREHGERGKQLEEMVLQEARRGGTRIIGPNCVGLMSPITGLQATFATAAPIPGSVGFLSQSGALCTAVLDWSLREKVGFSAFISVGAMIDVGWGDLIDYLGDDPNTRSIVIYMESVGDARSFLSAAREVALTKPIIVLKVGRTEAAARAAASHTGALAGSDQTLDAAFRRCGVLRVERVEDLFNMAEILGKQPRPRGPRLAIVTNAGGPGVLATDALISEGGELAQLTDETIQKLNEFLPPHWSHANPVDIIGDANAGRYAKATELVLNDTNADGLLAMLTPQAMTDPTQTAEHLSAIAKSSPKPVLASWMGGATITAGEAILAQANIPTFPYPDSAARAFHYMWKFQDNLRALYETPLALPESAESLQQRAQAEALLNSVRFSSRTLLSEAESKQLLACCGIPVAPTREARSAEEAVAQSEEIGYPVVLKLLSHTLTHKKAVGGVRLNLPHPDAVRRAFAEIQASVSQKAGPEHFLGVTVQPMVSRDGIELIVGSTLDAQFGPVLLFGAGGEMVEVMQDRALGLPPLNTTLARRMMERTRIFQALAGTHSRTAVNLAALDEMLVRFSQIVVEHRSIREIDINPLLATSDGLLTLDARVILHPPSVPEKDLPRLAIRPYPTQYAGEWTAPGGQTFYFRPVRPDDEPLMADFHRSLSEQSVHLRYFGTMPLAARISHERLVRVCFIDYDRQMALVAVHTDAATDQARIAGVCRLVKRHDSAEAGIGILVADPYQGRGLGSELVRRLIAIAPQEGIQRIVAVMLPENLAMKQMFRKLGFQLRLAAEEQVLEAELAIAT